MHHRRRSRRRDKRTMLSCGCCEDIRSGRGLPRIDEPEVCMGKAKKRKPRPKKSRCSKGGAHEWYREWIEEKDFRREVVSRCLVCEVEHEKWIIQHERWKREFGWDYSKWGSPYQAYYCTLHGEKKFFTRRRKVATCLKCWEVKVEKTTDDYYDLWWPSSRKMVLPKRPVKELCDE